MATVTITGTLLNAVDDTPHKGVGFIEPTTPVLVDSGRGVVMLSGKQFTLDEAGHFSVTVRATDDSALSPVGFTYRIGFRLSTGEVDTFTFYAPAAFPTLDLSQITPVLADAGDAVIVIPTGGGSVSDATASVKGVVQLAGDLSGTAAAPTVPALASKAALSHTHPQSDVTGLSTALTGKSDTGHAHAQSDVTGLTTALSGKAAAVHTHAQADVTGLVTALSGKAATTHTHAQSDVTNLVSDLAGKASNVHVHSATDITSGVLPIGRLGASGTPSSTTFLRGDNTWATPAGGGGTSFPVTYSGGPASVNVYPAGCNAAGTGRPIGSQPAGSRLVWFPFDLGACTITGFACNVTAAGNGSAVIKVGLWDDYGGVRPKTLQSTLGSAVATSTGIKTVTGASFVWPGGRLWVGAVEQGHTSVCAEIVHDYAVGAVATTQPINNPYSAIAQDGVSAALPTTAAGENALTDMRPRIWLVIQ